MSASMSRLRLFFCLALIAWIPCSAASAQDELGGVTEKHVMIPMRDGVKLSAYLYFPEGKGPWPVLYEQRYADLRGLDTRKSFARLAAKGYVVCGENFRGTHQSEGNWVGYRALGWGEKQDGYDTVEWFAKQTWCTGKVGTFGSSQAGFAQNFLAVTQPPHLTAQYMIDTGLSLYQEGYRIGGTTRPERFRLMDTVCRNAQDNRRLMEAWFSHPTYDAYWAEEDCSRFFNKMDVPCFTIGSWYDFMSVGSIDSYVGRQHQGGKNSQGKQQLLLGPWLHGRFNKTSVVSELAYPDNASFDVEAHIVRWFDYWLKGQQNGVDKDPVVRYYVMGAANANPVAVAARNEKYAPVEPGPANVWREAKDWPIKSEPQSLYLASGGKLGVDAPMVDRDDISAATTYLADPVVPMQIPSTRGFPGAADARVFEKQSDVRTFTTEPLANAVEWTGKVQAELFVSSSAPDSDFIVRICDVYPDGRSILIMDMVRRARYREGYEKEVLMEPGQIYKVAFDIGWLSQVFHAGHRIRVTVASTGAPFYEPNPNTGKKLTIAFPQETFVARNNVHHHRGAATRIIAPIVPASR